MLKTMNELRKTLADFDSKVNEKIRKKLLDRFEGIISAVLSYIDLKIENGVRIGVFDKAKDLFGLELGKPEMHEGEVIIKSREEFEDGEKRAIEKMNTWIKFLGDQKFITCEEKLSLNVLVRELNGRSQELGKAIVESIIQRSIEPYLKAAKPFAKTMDAIEEIINKVRGRITS